MPHTLHLASRSFHQYPRPRREAGHTAIQHREEDSEHPDTCMNEHTTHSKAGGLPRFDQLDMSRHCILTDTTFHPDLPQLVGCLVDGHACLKVVHAAEHQVHRLPPFAMTMTATAGQKGSRDCTRFEEQTDLMHRMKCAKFCTVVMS